MKQYHKLLKDILEHGQETKDRTGVGTKSIFGYQMRFNLQDGFPAVTTKKLQFKSCVGEILWFLEGSTDERRLAELTYGKNRSELVGKTTIWTANADAQGKSLGYVNNDFSKQLGPVYAAQWRDFGAGRFDGSVDQISWIINEIKNNPDSRRLILSAWNPVELSKMALPPCHVLCQFRVYNGNLNCQMYQRSADAGLGVPFNIASYALLTHIIARECGLGVGDFVHTIGDAHIYLNHIDKLKEQLERPLFPLPELVISNNFDLERGLDFEFEIGDADKFTLKNYLHHPTIEMDMAV